MITIAFTFGAGKAATVSKVGKMADAVDTVGDMAKIGDATLDAARATGGLWDDIGDAGKWVENIDAVPAKTGGSIESVGKGAGGALDEPGKTNISPVMEKKILEGQRKVKPQNEVIRGHSNNIVNNDNPNLVVEIISTNPDGEVSKIKNNNTLFPNTWSDESIIKGIKSVGDTPPIGFRPRDGAKLHRDIINGVQIEVIKVGPDITSGYPTGGGSTGLITGFDPIKP